MRRWASTIAVMLGMLALIAGCQSDNAVNQPTTDTGGTGLVRGEITAGTASFEFPSQTDSSVVTPPGPFVVRGSNVTYDAGNGTLAVDLTVINVGTRAYPEPAHLTFVQLLPADVTVMGADNDSTGVGAMITLAFANDDGMWTPGEESLARTVRFSVPSGPSVGFAVRIDVGTSAMGGAIGGLVWNDANGDGILDPDETGIADVGVRVDGGVNQHWLSVTQADGTYRIDGLPAGFYTVTRLPRGDLQPTTPVQLQVLLAATDSSGVSDFLTADFGCRIAPPDTVGGFQVGDCVGAKGVFARDPARLTARILGDCDEYDDDAGDCPQSLVGPVTAVGDSGVAVMGTRLAITRASRIDLRRIMVGQRVWADVSVVPDDQGHHLVLTRLRGFNGHFDRVNGVIQDIVTDDQGRPMRVRILDTDVVFVPRRD